MFWGCTIPARFPFIEKSTRVVLDDLGVEPVDVPGFTCCPETTLVRPANEWAYHLTAARNLAVAEQTGLPLLTPCNGCYSTFKSVLSELKVDWRLKAKVNDRLAAEGLGLSGDIDVRHLVEWLSEDLGPATLAARVQRPLWGIKLAVHYGCHLLRPSPAIRWDSAAAPSKFEQLTAALGGTVIDYPTKLECCGNALDRVGEREASLSMCGSKLADVAKQGADALVVSCPSCFLQFDLNQATQLREARHAGIPVFYITELIALAMGHDPAALGLHLHRVSVEPFLEKWKQKLELRTTLTQSFNLNELQTCASCGACDENCPVASINEDFVPSALMAALVAGEIDDLVGGEAIWRCADCLTCYERCHSRIGMAAVFERLKHMAHEKGSVPAAVRSGYEAFLEHGTLGTGRPATRAKLGLPPLPETGRDALHSLLGKCGGESE